LSEVIKRYTALVNNQGFFFLALSLLALSAAVNENNIYGFFLFSIALFFQANVKSKELYYILAIIIISFFIGYEALVILYPIFLFKKGYKKIAINISIGLILIKSCLYLFGLVPDVSINGINLASLMFIFFPTLLVLILYEKKFKKYLINFYISAFIIIGSILISNNWINPFIISSEYTRILLLTLPVLLLINSGNIKVSSQIVDFDYKSILFFSFIFLIFIFSLNNKKYEEIIFDESHGNWAAVNNNFNEASFGRNYFYSYSILKEFIQKKYSNTVITTSEDITLDNKKSLFVIKMPITKLSNDYIEKVSNWVSKGGHLLVIADHTNLYNSTFYLNELLDNFSIKISETAVFDKEGRPNKNKNSLTSFLFPTVDSNIDQMEWLTGTSLEYFPANFIPLGFYNLSYSEEGDYSNPNRFGRFQPRLDLPLINHISFGKTNYKKGSVFILLDSTPWSNFALSKEMYKKFVNNILKISETKLLDVKHYLLLVFVGYFAFQIIFKEKKIYSFGIFLLLIYFLLSFISGRYMLPKLINETDYDTLVYSGKKVNYEFLNQLIPLGENNFTRIVGSLNRNGLNPLIIDKKEKSIDLEKSKRILAIQPTFNQLPHSYEVIDYLKNGGSLTLLFSKNQSSDSQITKWLSELEIFIKQKNNYGFVESIRNEKDNLLSRDQTFAIKDISWLAYASSSSLFKLQYINNIIQSFLIRPINLPYHGGYLNISFSAEQFSDSVVGDIWEGIIPNNISVQQERMLAKLINGNFQINLTKEFINNNQNKLNQFKKYALFEDGKIILNGEFIERNYDNFNPSKNIETYLYSLLNQSLSFIKNNCLGNIIISDCPSNYVSQDMIEWRIKFRKEKNHISAIELIHQRDLNGLNFTYNIVFAK